MKRFVLVCLVLIMSSGFALAQSVKGLEMHGYIMNRFYANPDKAAAFSVERVSISAKADLPEEAKMYVELYIHPWVSDKVVNNVTAEQSRHYLESAYIDMPTRDGFLRIGKGRGLNFGITPSYGNRKTTQYGSLAETFSQDRITGIQYCVTNDNFDGGISIYDAMHVGNRGLGSYPVSSNVVKHIAERDDNANLSGKLAVSGKVGWKHPNFNWHVSGSVSKMISAEADKIAGFYNPSVVAGTADRTMSKYGVDATYKKGNLFGSIEAYRGEYSVVRIDGYGLILGYEPKEKPRIYCAYNVLTNNLAPTATQETWDTRQTIIGYVYPVSKGVWLEANFIKNQEVPGASLPTVKNDLFFIELFTSI